MGGKAPPDVKVTPKDMHTGLPDGYKVWPCDSPGKACNAHDPCAVNAVCGQDKQCWPQSVMNCDDGLDCTTDTCKGMGLCSNVPKTGYCKLGVKVAGSQTCKDLKLDGGSKGTPDGGAGQTIVCCFKKGARNPADRCQECNPDTSGDGGSKSGNTSWSPANGGACDDGDGCTKDDYCQAGTCKGTAYGSACKDALTCTDDLCDGKGGCLGHKLKTNYCLINGDCYLDKVAHPSGTCEACDASSNQYAWSKIKDSCMIDGKCYAKGAKHPAGCAECDASKSTTQWTVKGTTACFIDKVCRKSGDKDPSGCSSCQPTKSTSAWTPLTAVCNIGGKCLAKGTKHPAGCAECDPAVSATKWTNVGTTHCLINDQCQVKGAKDSSGCSECDPGQDKYNWSAVTNACKIGGQCLAKGAKHPAGCAECDPTVSATKWTNTGTTHCLINDQCQVKGAKDSSGCNECDPGQDKYAWSLLAGLCKIDNKCHAKGDKHPGGCAECDPTKSATQWTLTVVGQCLIEGKCYKDGDTVGCSKCDVALSTTAWSKVPGCSQLELQLPQYYKTYSASTHARGYWFQAPVSFTIVGLRVPTDVGQEVQNVAVLRFSGPVPVWPTLGGNFTVLHYSKGVAGSGWITVNVPIKKGEIIGVVGARGTSTMRNSYAQFNNVSSAIAGNSVTLQRLASQSNLYQSQPTSVAGYSAASGNLGRVELRYTP